MWTRPYPSRWTALAIGATLPLGMSCATEVDPLRVEERRVLVENRTSADWSDVEIWVNDHYRATVATLAAGGRLVAPLDGFVAGFGQRFDPNHRVTGIEVTARTATGEPITMTWGEGRRR